MWQRVADQSVLRAFALVFDCAVMFLEIVRRRVAETAAAQPRGEETYFLSSDANEMTAESAALYGR